MAGEEDIDGAKLEASEEDAGDVDPFEFEPGEETQQPVGRLRSVEELGVPPKEETKGVEEDPPVVLNKMCLLPRCKTGDDGSRGLIVGKRKYCMPHHRAFESVHRKFVMPLDDKDPQVHTDNSEFKAFKSNLRLQ